MHDSSIPQDVIDTLIERRGRLHVIESLEPTRTALLVIDMQNFFVEEGQPSEVAVARDIVPNINRVAAAAREVGCPVFWVRVTLEDADFDEWSVFLDYRDENARDVFRGLEPGNHGWELWPELDVQDGDQIVDKTRFSAFIQGSSGLDSILKARGIDTLLITGTLTNVCCESTARDAMMLNYRTTMVSDANAAVTDEAHRASLVNVLQFFGDVYSTDEVCGLLHCE